MVVEASARGYSRPGLPSSCAAGAILDTLEGVIDDELRDLERTAREADRPGARLRWARALRRVGREDEALEALRPALADAAVRREVGTFAAWTHPDGGAGGAFAVDVAPLRGRPEVLWRTRVGGALMPWLLASPLAVVVGGDGRTLVLEPDTGAVRRQLESGGLPHGPTIRGDRIVLPAQTLLAERDLTDGTSRFGALIPHDLGLRVAGDLLLTASRAGLDAHRLPALDAAGQPEPLWSRPLPGGMDPRPFATRLIVCGDRVVTRGEVHVDEAAPVTHVVRELGGGAELFRVDAAEYAIGDAAGILVTDAKGVALRGLDGAERWRFDDVPSPRATALAPELAIVSVEGEPGSPPGFHVIDRRSGAARPLATGAEPLRPAAIARNMIYAIDRQTVAAFGPDGVARWRLELPAPPSPTLVLAAAPHRLYILSLGGDLLCLGESPKHASTGNTDHQSP